MFKLCQKVQIPENDIQGFVPHYIIEDDEDNEGFGKSEESCLESDSQELLQRLWRCSETNETWGSLEKEGSDQSMVCKKQS